MIRCKLFYWIFEGLTEGIRKLALRVRPQPYNELRNKINICNCLKRIYDQIELRVHNQLMRASQLMLEIKNLRHDKFKDRILNTR